MSNITEINKKRILLVEDHPLFRAMLVQLIDSELGMMVAGETDNVKEALHMLGQNNPDAVIVDITLHGASGLELIKDMKAMDILVPVLVLSMHEEALYAERVIRAGARGYVSKHESPSEVVAAIQKVLAGQIYVSERITRSFLQNLAGNGKGAGSSELSVLSDREIEVFQLVGRGLNSREISERINLGLTTVDTYRARIRQKLGIRNAAELYQRAARWVTEIGTDSNGA